MHGIFKALLLVIVISSLIACAKRQEMPITTSSVEARELFIEARDLSENWKNEEGDTLLESALELDPEFALAHLYMRGLRGFKEASAYVDQVSRGESLMIRATNELHSGAFRKCNLLIDTLIKLYPRDRHCLLFAGALYIRRDTLMAIKYFRKAIKLDPYYGAAYANLALQYAMTGEISKAEDLYKRFIDLPPETVTAHSGYGAFLVNQGRFDEALIQLNQAVFVDPSYPYPHIRRILVYVRMGDYKNAEKYCDVLMKQPTVYDRPSSNRANAQMLMAAIRYLQGDLDGAVDIYDLIIAESMEDEIDDSQYFALQNKAWFEIVGGRPDKSIETLERGLKEAGNDISELRRVSSQCRFLATLSISYGAQGDMLKAKEYIDLAANKLEGSRMADQNSNYFSLAMGIYQLHLKNYESAVDDLKFWADRLSVAHQFYLASAYERLGEYEQAKKYYTLATISIAPARALLFYDESLARLEALK